MTTVLELDNRVSSLEEYVWNDLSVRLDAMNWALGQTYANTEATRHDLAGIKVDLAHLETSSHKDMVTLKTAFDLRISDLRRDLNSTESSLRHDIRKLSDDVNRRFGAVDERFSSVDQRFDTVDQRFSSVDQRFDSVDQRFDSVDQRFNQLEGKVDMILAEIQAMKTVNSS